MFPQSPDQTTLTVEWINTRKSGRNDADIELVQKSVLVDRELRVNQKMTLRSPSSKVIAVFLRSGIEMS